jgi:hypothetical protein
MVFTPYTRRWGEKTAKKNRTAAALAGFVIILKKTGGLAARSARVLIECHLLQSEPDVYAVGKMLVGVWWQRLGLGLFSGGDGRCEL